MSKNKTTIKATLNRADEHGDVLSRRDVNVRACWGEKPHLVEIILEDNDTYFDYVLIDLEELRELLNHGTNC